jgi:hypothetical protein
MEYGEVIIPSPRSEYIELARTATGVRFRKHILNLGTLIHPKTHERLNLDAAWYDKLKANFDRGVCDSVAAPLANDKNEHVEGVLDNAGEVLGVSREGSKVYVDIDVRRPEVVQGLRNRTILGASAFLHMNYTDTNTGEKVGPTLLHSCFTNRPYVVGLDPYEEVIAATSDGMGEVVMLTEEEPQMDRETLIATLRDEHGIDVEDLQRRAAQASDVSGLTRALTGALTGQSAQEVSLTASDGSEITLSTVVGAVAELAQLSRAQDAEVTKLRRGSAEKEVDDLIGVGRIMPKAREDMIALAMEDHDRMLRLIPDEPILKLNAVAGSGGSPQGEQNHTTDIDAELARYTNATHTSRFFSANGTTKK